MVSTGSVTFQFTCFDKANECKPDFPGVPGIRLSFCTPRLSALSACAVVVQGGEVGKPFWMLSSYFYQSQVEVEPNSCHKLLISNRCHKMPEFV